MNTHREAPTQITYDSITEEAPPCFPWGVVEAGQVVGWFRERRDAEAFAALAPGRRVEHFPVLPIVREAAG